MRVGKVGDTLGIYMNIPSIFFDGVQNFAIFAITSGEEMVRSGCLLVDKADALPDNHEGRQTRATTPAWQKVMIKLCIGITIEGI